MRGANRDELKIEMAKTYPNSKHFLTYRHSLRSYASILYLRIPPGYRMILRGKEIEHHDVVNDLMMTKEITYRPLVTDPTIRKNDPNMVATGTIGFVKDAKAHFDIQGFNVYHKNRLIKPFWRVWNAAGSDGRGVIGVLEANFVEPAHDKQGFERTTALARLECRLIKMQKDFWCTNCQEIGYAARRNKKAHALEAEADTSSSSPPTKASAKNNSNSKVESSGKKSSPLEKVSDSRPEAPPQPPASHEASPAPPPAKTHKSNPEMGDVIMAEPISMWKPNGGLGRSAKQSNPEVADKTIVGDAEKKKNTVESLAMRLEEEQGKCKELEKKLELAQQMIEQKDKENETLIDIFSEERSRREVEEDELRKRLKDAYNTIQELLDKVKSLEESRIAK